MEFLKSEEAFSEENRCATVLYCTRSIVPELRALQFSAHLLPTPVQVKYVARVFYSAWGQILNPSLFSDTFSMKRIKAENTGVGWWSTAEGLSRAR